MSNGSQGDAGGRFKEKISNLLGGRRVAGNGILTGVMRIGSGKSSFPPRELDTAEFEIVGTNDAEVFVSKDTGNFEPIFYKNKCEPPRDEGYSKVKSSKSGTGDASKKVVGKTLVQDDVDGKGVLGGLVSGAASLSSGVSIRKEDIISDAPKSVVLEKDAPTDLSEKVIPSTGEGDLKKDEVDPFVGEVKDAVPEGSVEQDPVDVREPLIETSSEELVVYVQKSTGLRCLDPLHVAAEVEEEVMETPAQEEMESLLVISDPVPTETITESEGPVVAAVSEVPAEAVEAPSSDVQPVVDETVSTDVTEEPVAVPVVEVPVSEGPVVAAVSEVPAEAVEAPSSDVQPVVDETVSTDVTEEPVAVPVVEVPVSEEPVPADKPVEDVIDETSGVNGDVQEYAYLTAIDGYMKTLPEGPVRYESKDSVPIAEGVKPAQDLTVLVVASESHNAEQGREASKGLKESKFKPAVKGLKGVEPDTETVVSENVPITIKKADEVPTSQRASWDKLGSMSEPTFIRRGRRMSYKDGVLVSTKEKDPLDDFDKSQAERIKRATMTVTRPEEEKVVEKKEEPKLSELVRPSVRNLAVPPMEIKDEVVDVMRFAVPNIMSDEFGEEDLSEIPDDGIEALCCQVTSCPEAVPSDGCPAVFSFGNGDSEPDGIRFFFGSY